MAERDINAYSINVDTKTSKELGVTSFKAVKKLLEANESLARVVKGQDTRVLGVEIASGGSPIDADSNSVTGSVYDIYDNLITSSIETRNSIGDYSFNFSPPASSEVGIYKTLHQYQINGENAEINEHFRVVDLLPGNYNGTIIKSQDTWTGVAKVVDDSGLLIDPDSNDVKVTITTSRGIVLIRQVTATRVDKGLYTYSYAPTLNDPTGGYYVLFEYAINSQSDEYDLYFNVNEKEEELWVDVQDFKNSVEGKSISDVISDYTDEEIANQILDAQNQIKEYIGQDMSKHVVSGERVKSFTDTNGIMKAKLCAKPVYKLLKVQTRTQANGEMITLPVSDWDINHDTGIIKYITNLGNESREVPLNQYINSLFVSDLDLFVDYEAGYDRIPGLLQQVCRLFAAGNIEDFSGKGRLAEIKSGNYKEKYFSPVTNSGSAQFDKRTSAFNLLKNSKYSHVGIA